MLVGSSKKKKKDIKISYLGGPGSKPFFSVIFPTNIFSLDVYLQTNPPSKRLKKSEPDNHLMSVCLKAEGIYSVPVQMP